MATIAKPRHVPLYVRGIMAFFNFVLCGLGGFMFGDYMSRSAVDQIDRRQLIEDACMAGNANACTLFSVKFGKGR